MSHSPASRPAESTESTGTSGAEEHNNGIKRRGREPNTSANNGSKEEPNALSSTPVMPAETQRTHAAGEGEDRAEQDLDPERQGEARLMQADDTGTWTDLGAQEGSARTPGSVEAGGLEPPSPAEAPAANNLDFDLSSDSDSESVTEKPPNVAADSIAGGDPKRSPSSVCDQQDAGPTQNPGCGEGPEGDGGKAKVEVVTAAAAEESKEAEAVGNSATQTLEPPPGGAVPPGPEDLGNGCSDKREPETESQNSELSGVTAGEELLEQSMEEEEEEEEEEEDDPDQDDHLIYLEEVLQRIHAEYYARYEVYQRKEVPEMPDIRRIVPELKGKVLEGATIVFSGLYPTNYPMERTREYYHAKVLGAKIGRGLVLNAEDPCRTTHLIAARAGTLKTTASYLLC